MHTGNEGREVPPHRSGGGMDYIREHATPPVAWSDAEHRVREIEAALDTIGDDDRADTIYGRDARWLLAQVRASAAAETERKAGLLPDSAPLRVTRSWVEDLRVAALNAEQLSDKLDDHDDRARLRAIAHRHRQRADALESYLPPETP